MRAVTLFLWVVLFTSTFDGFSQRSGKQTILSIQPHLPVFLRQGDHTELQFIIQNTSDSEITGQVQLELKDAANGQSVDGWFINTFPNQYFTVAPGKRESVKFPVEIPYQFASIIKWKVTARSDKYIDAQEHLLPVVSNKYFITDKFYLPVSTDLNQTITINKLTGSDTNERIQNHGLVFEYSSGSLWYLLQAFAFLRQYPFESTDKLWNECFANALSLQLSSAPFLSSLFRNRTINDTTYLSLLQKDKELSSFLTIQTPWVLEQPEWQQVKGISMFFDTAGTADDLDKSLIKLQQVQLPNGAFPWFTNGRADRSVTEYILEGMGRLKKLDALHGSRMAHVDTLAGRALVYLDHKLKEDYSRSQKEKANQHLDEQIIEYLYARSFFTDHPMSADTKAAFDHFLKQAQGSWSTYNIRLRSMIILALHRMGNDVSARKLAEALKKTSVNIQKDLNQSASAATVSLIMECFKELQPDVSIENTSINQLIADKETYNWKTTRATADACYALFLYGIDPSANNQKISIKAGNLAFSNSYAAGGPNLSYFKRSVDASMIKPEMGNITVTASLNKSTSPPHKDALSWFTVYWQYFEDEKPAGNTLPVLLKKKLFLVHNKAGKKELTVVQPGTILHVGDTLNVSIEINSSQDIEYLHIQDVNASNLEPLYNEKLKWQHAPGYYETCETTGIHLLYPLLKKGIHRYTYNVVVTYAGIFSNGTLSAQKYYAPESNTRINDMPITAEE